MAHNGFPGGKPKDWFPHRPGKTWRDKRSGAWLRTRQRKLMGTGKRPSHVEILAAGDNS